MRPRGFRKKVAEADVEGRTDALVQDRLGKSELQGALKGMETSKTELQNGIGYAIDPLLAFVRPALCYRSFALNQLAISCDPQSFPAHVSTSLNTAV